MGSLNIKSLLAGFKEPDKLQHLLVGIAISTITGTLLGWVAGITIGIAAGALKEWWDSRGHGTAEFADFIFTLMGAILGAIPAAFLHWLIF